MRKLPLFMVLALALPLSVPASDQAPAELNLSSNSPDLQRLKGEAAVAQFAKLAQLIGAGRNHELDRKNLAELALQSRNLNARNYFSQEKDIRKGDIAGPAVTLSFQRVNRAIDKDEAGNAFKEIQTFDFYHAQVFLKKGERPRLTEAVPYLVMRRKAYLGCPLTAGPCEILRVVMHQTITRWSYPPTGRGAESSAGGVLTE